MTKPCLCDIGIKVGKYFTKGMFSENWGGKFIVCSTMSIKAIMKMKAISSDRLKFEKLNIQEEIIEFLNFNKKKGLRKSLNGLKNSNRGSN